MATPARVRTAKQCLTLTLALSLAAALAASVSSALAAEPSSEQLEFFEKIIRPLLSAHCYDCHSTQAKRLEGGLLLDSKAGWEKGGQSGPVIVSGEPEKSRLILMVKEPALSLSNGPALSLPN